MYRCVRWGGLRPCGELMGVSIICSHVGKVVSGLVCVHVVGIQQQHAVVII